LDRNRYVGKREEEKVTKTVCCTKLLVEDLKARFFFLLCGWRRVVIFVIFVTCLECLGAWLCVCPCLCVFVCVLLVGCGEEISERVSRSLLVPGGDRNKRGGECLRCARHISFISWCALYWRDKTPKK
jgi:hypothetical protein